MKNMVFEVYVNGSHVIEMVEYDKAWEMARELAFHTKLPVKLVTVVK